MHLASAAASLSANLSEEQTQAVPFQVNNSPAAPALHSSTQVPKLAVLVPQAAPEAHGLQVAKPLVTLYSLGAAQVLSHFCLKAVVSSPYLVSLQVQSVALSLRLASEAVHPQAAAPSAEIYPLAASQVSQVAFEPSEAVPAAHFLSQVSLG